MKHKVLSAVVLLLAVICLCSCGAKEIRLDTGRSHFTDFRIEDDKVYIYCDLLIRNPNRDETTITVTGSFEKDAENGLLKEAVLNGYDPDCETSEFVIIGGDNQLRVVFIGDYAGNDQKHDRLLPEIRINELHS